MTSTYYFDTDERNSSVKVPKLSKQEKFDMKSDDDKWFDYMLEKYEKKPYTHIGYQQEWVHYETIEATQEYINDLEDVLSENDEENDDENETTNDETTDSEC